MLPTLAERLREQQAKTRSRRPSRDPWPVPTDPPTALLFLPGGEKPGPELPGPEPLVPMEAVHVDTTPPQARTALAEVLLLLLWAVVVLVDGALALASLIGGVALRNAREQGSSGPATPSALPGHGARWSLAATP
ncbi:MAG: hypothetical protein QUV07_14055 [Cyanobium sp. CZS 25K]|nr:hypothetical protein [Cyanobium sp. CZS25K]